MAIEPILGRLRLRRRMEPLPPVAGQIASLDREPFDADRVDPDLESPDPGVADRDVSSALDENGGAGKRVGRRSFRRSDERRAREIENAVRSRDPDRFPQEMNAGPDEPLRRDRARNRERQGRRTSRCSGPRARVARPRPLSAALDSDRRQRWSCARCSEEPRGS